MYVVNIPTTSIEYTRGCMERNGKLVVGEVLFVTFSTGIMTFEAYPATKYRVLKARSKYVGDETTLSTRIK